MIIAIILNLIIIVLEVIAFTNQLRHDSERYFIYYTHLSNIFAGLTSILFVVAAIIMMAGGSPVSELVRGLRLMSTSTVALTFIIVVTVLAPSIGITKGGYKKMLITHNAKYVHLICPLLSIISFAFFECGPKLEFGWTLITIIPTVIYGVVAVINNYKRVWDGPYNFLKVHDQSLAASIVWSFVVLGGAYLIGLILWCLSSIKAFPA